MEDNKILSSTENFGNVSVCQGGIVHVNLLHFSLKFVPSDFLKFCELIGKARLNFEQPRRSDGKPKLHVVPSDENQTAPDDTPNQL